MPRPSRVSATSRTRPRHALPNSEKDTQQLLGLLAEQQKMGAELQDQVASAMTFQPVSAPRAWGVWLGAMAEELHPEVMGAFYQQSMDLIRPADPISEPPSTETGNSTT